VIETARALVDADIDRSIDFISFGCEEAGSPGYQYYLWGSRQYIKKHKGDIGDIACILNCELAGHSNSNHLVIDCTPDLVSFFETISEDLSKHIKSHNLKASIGIAVPTSSQADQLNFSLAGVPSSLFNWAWYDEYHSNIDTADRLETSKLKIFCKLLLLSAYRISTTNKLPLSLTRYARILKMGHKGISSHLSPDIMEVHASGIEHLKRIGGDTVNFDMALRTLEEFARTAAQFEREFARTDDEGSIARMNRILLDACSDLNSGLCKSGGVLGEDAMFPGYMEYVEELRKISEAVNSIARVKGSDMPDYVLTEFVPIRSPEISCKEFDVHKELNLLNEKRDKLAQSIQREIDRINSIIMAATKKIERQA
ncbi:MAG: M28 family peptidase, partial [Thermoplasmata archaeon]|nr:M28 family peptidase [Thermoplasmata archaeon]